jgi:hypothetical protein
LLGAPFNDLEIETVEDARNFYCKIYQAEDFEATFAQHIATDKVVMR